jgi:hypothetical protein
MSKYVEEQEARIHSEGSRKKKKKDRREVSRGKEGTVTPISSQPLEGSEKENSVVGEPTTSKKKKSTQS